MKKEGLEQLKQAVQEKAGHVNAFIQRVWFKAGLLFLVAFVFSQKDFSFHINMNAADRNFNPKSEMTSLNVALTDQQKVYPGLTGVLPEISEKEKPPKPVMTEAEQAAAAKQLAYVDRFAHVAQAEMMKYGIPASITLAQGILESRSGSSRLATRNNNHFGIKCFSKKCGKGHCSNFEDDHHKDFFRNYDSAWASYRDHSKLLTSKHYRHLQKLGKSDYKGWAKGLEKAGYATAKNYGDKLIRLIENLDLVAYDEP